MKNMVYCFICNLLLLALLILTSCGRQDDSVAKQEDVTVSSQGWSYADTFTIVRQQDALYHMEKNNRINFSNLSNKDTAMSKVYDKSQKNLIRWSISGGL